MQMNDDSERNIHGFLKDLGIKKREEFMLLDWKEFRHLGRLEKPSVHKKKLASASPAPQRGKCSLSSVCEHAC